MYIIALVLEEYVIIALILDEHVDNCVGSGGVCA